MADDIVTMPDTGSPLSPMDSSVTGPAQKPKAKPRPRAQSKKSAPLKPTPPKKTPPPMAPAASSGGMNTGLAIGLIVLVGVIGAAAAGAGVFYWQQGIQGSELAIKQQANDAVVITLKDQLGEAESMLEAKEDEFMEMTAQLDTPDVMFESDDDLTVKVMDGSSEVGTITVDIPSKFSILKQTANAVYLLQDPMMDGDFIFYGFNQPNLYKYDVRAQTIDEVFGAKEGVSIQDVSDDEQWLVYRKVTGTDPIVREVILRNIETGLEQSFAVEDSFSQFGDITFSPNGKKIAYAGVGGDPFETQTSALFIIDVENKTTKKVTEDDNRVYHINGWKGNMDDNISYYYFPQ